MEHISNDDLECYYLGMIKDEAELALLEAVSYTHLTLPTIYSV